MSIIFILTLKPYFRYLDDTASLHYAWHFEKQRQVCDERRNVNLLEMLIVPVVHGPAEFARFSDGELVAHLNETMNFRMGHWPHSIPRPLAS